MQWYYAQNGQQLGPVSAEEFQRLMETGAVAGNTLVWREGMSSWQPLSALQPSAEAANPPPQPTPGQHHCAECQRPFAESELLRYENLRVCATCKPIFFQKIREGVVPGSQNQLWRSGKFLVLRHDAEFPLRCVKCDAAASGQPLRRKLYWHHPGYYWLLIINLLVYAIVASFVSRRARIHIRLCPRHVRRRTLCLALNWLLTLSSLATLCYGFAEANVFVVLGGLGLLLIGVIFGMVTCSMVTPKRIDERLIWLKGVDARFLEGLPEFTERI